MCGRFAITSPRWSVEQHFKAWPADPEDLGPDAPRRNVSPTERIPVVVSRPGARALVGMRWGFIPHWYRAPNDGPRIINARAEGIAGKPAFREAVRSRRCLIPADGFYEWKGAKAPKTPYVIGPRAGGLIAFAGLWQDLGNAPTCAIVTCAANATLAPLHHRMPVVVAPEAFPLWLGEAGDGASRLMVPAEDDLLEAWPADAETRAVLARPEAARRLPR
jgi:putative SOS response-associated peptidase YedK